MASRTKKVAVPAGDTVTFKKSELVSKLKSFLEDNDACDGDWVNKVKVEFLGQTLSNVNIKLKVAAEVSLDMAADGLPSKEEVMAHIRAQLDEGNMDECDFSFDLEDMEVEKVTKEA